MVKTEEEVEVMKRKVTNALISLGETPEAVAESLRQQGIRGYREDKWQCPIARYLKLQLGIDDVENCAQFVYVESGGTHDGEVPVPSAVEDFTDLFDGGRYPDLTA